MIESESASSDVSVAEERIGITYLISLSSSPGMAADQRQDKRKSCEGSNGMMRSIICPLARITQLVGCADGSSQLKEK